MINGILVINHYMQSNKFNELYNMLIKSSHDNNINLSVITNREIMIDTDFLVYNREVNNKSLKLSEIDFALFWDKDVLLAKYLENKGIKVYNCSEAIRICDDKALTHVELTKYNIRMPRTIIQPFTFDDVYKSDDYIDEIIDKLSFPIVVKTRVGSFGSGVYLVNNKTELKDVINKFPPNSLIFQEFIDSSIGKDIRIQVVGDEVVCSMYRYSDTDFRANITNGGKMKIYNPTEDEKKLARDVCKYLKLDFAGVDILWDRDNKPMICEVNSNAHFVNLYNLTGVNTADFIMRYIKELVEIEN